MPNKPLADLQHFFREYPIRENRELLWLLITSAVSYKHAPGHQREVFMIYYRQLKDALEAMNEFLEKNEQGKG